jgi:hypothetical protein
MSEDNEDQPSSPNEQPENVNPGPLPPVMKPDQTTEAPPPGKTYGGPHDLTDHPAVASGNIRNPGDTVIGRDPNAPNFRRPPLEDPPSVAEQSEGERSTTTEAPAKKSSRGKSKGEGAGPES